MKYSSCTIALSPGAENGVGPELMLISLENLKKTPCQFLWCGDRASLELASSRATISLKFLNSRSVELRNGLMLNFLDDFPTLDQQQRTARFLEQCISHAQQSNVHAIVTGPIEKSALSFLPGGPWPGQTEYFAHHLGVARKPFMAFLGGPFIMSMLTVHVPLKNVPNLITQERIGDAIEMLAHECAPILGKTPKKLAIAVLGLNPHAGEHGLLGGEEIEHSIPAIKNACKNGYNVSGPWAADGFFGYFHKQESKPDVVLAMYHDQGLIPYKLLAQGHAINVTLGLKIPRTSPAHGTAQELVGTGQASFLSTLKALELAIQLASQTYSG